MHYHGALMLIARVFKKILFLAFLINVMGYATNIDTLFKKRSHCKASLEGIINQGLESNDPNTGLVWVEKSKTFAINFEKFTIYHNQIGNSTAKWESIKNRMTKSKTGFICLQHGGIPPVGYDFLYTHKLWAAGSNSDVVVRPAYSTASSDQTTANSNYAMAENSYNTWPSQIPVANINTAPQYVPESYGYSSSTMVAPGQNNDSINIRNNDGFETVPLYPQDKIPVPSRGRDTIPSVPSTKSSDIRTVATVNYCPPSATKTEPTFDFAYLLNIEIFPTIVLRTTQPEAFQLSEACQLYIFNPELFLDEMKIIFQRGGYAVTENDRNNWLILLRNEYWPFNQGETISTNCLACFGQRFAPWTDLPARIRQFITDGASDWYQGLCEEVSIEDIFKTLPNNANYYCVRALKPEGKDLTAVFALTYRKKDESINHIYIYRNSLFQLYLLDEQDQIETYSSIAPILKRMFEEESFEEPTIPLSNENFKNLKAEPQMNHKSTQGIHKLKKLTKKGPQTLNVDDYLRQ